MKPLPPTLLLALTFALSFPGRAAAAEPTEFSGTYELADADATAGAVEVAVDQGVRQFPIPARPLARVRLRRSVGAAATMTFHHVAGRITVWWEGLAEGWTSDLDGTDTKVRDERGGSVVISRWMQAGKLVSRACRREGCANYSFSIRGDTLTMEMTATSHRLEEPLHLKAVYRRKD